MHASSDSNGYIKDASAQMLIKSLYEVLPTLAWYDRQIPHRSDSQKRISSSDDWHGALTGLSSAFQCDYMGKCLIEKYDSLQGRGGITLMWCEYDDSSDCLTILTRVRALVINSNPTEKSAASRQNLVALFYGSLASLLCDHWQAKAHKFMIYTRHASKRFPFWTSDF